MAGCNTSLPKTRMFSCARLDLAAVMAPSAAALSIRSASVVGVIVAGIYALGYASGARRALELDKIHVEKPPH